MTSHAAKACSDLFQTSRPSAGLGALVHRVAVIALLARRAIWLTALGRVSPQSPACSAMSEAEVALIGRIERRAAPVGPLADALARLAAIGGAEGVGAHASPFAVARGLSYIADIQMMQRLRAAKYEARK